MNWWETREFQAFIPFLKGQPANDKRQKKHMRLELRGPWDVERRALTFEASCVRCNEPIHPLNGCIGSLQRTQDASKVRARRSTSQGPRNSNRMCFFCRLSLAGCPLRKGMKAWNSRVSHQFIAVSLCWVELCMYVVQGTP